MSQAALPLNASVDANFIALMTIKTTSNQTWDIQHVGLDYLNAGTTTYVEMRKNNGLIHVFGMDFFGGASGGTAQLHLPLPVRMWPNDVLTLKWKECATAGDIVKANILYDDGQIRTPAGLHGKVAK